MKRKILIGMAGVVFILGLYDVVENHVGWLAAFELLQETHVVLREETEVLYAVFEVGDTLYTEAECIAGIDLRIDAARL